MKTKQWRYVLGFVLGAAVLARIVLSLDMINRPGLQYDETIFVNAATLRIPGWWIARQVFGIPLFVLTYTGALKSWLYAPIFSLFGTSAATVRVPVVLLVSGSLVLLYFAVKDLVNRPVALLTAVLLAFDQSVFWYTRNDVGPSALEFGLKCAALLCIARFWERRTLRWVVLLLVVLGAGVFNKLDFIWVVNAAVVVSLVAVTRNRTSLRPWRRAVLVWFTGAALICAGFGGYYLHYHIGNFTHRIGPAEAASIPLRWSQFIRGTSSVLSGTSFYSYALGPLGPRELVAAVMVALFAAGGVASFVRCMWRSPAVAGIALATVVIAFQCLITYQAVDGWHYIAIYPFFVIVAAYGSYVVCTAAFRSPARIAAALALVAMTALVYDGVLFATYSRGMTREPRNSAWSPAVYALSHYLRHQPGTVFTTDWGIADPLLVVAPSRRYREVFAAWKATHNPAGLIEGEVAHSERPDLFVTHAPGALVFRKTRTNLADGAGSKLSLIKTIDGLNSRPVFEVYRWR